MELVLPSTEFKESYLAAVREFIETDTDNLRSRHYRELSLPELERDFEAYVRKERGKALGENLPEGYVPETILWLVDNGEFIGRAGIRHELTEHLREIGGHIGYDIRPSKRGRGYGSEILARALPNAKALGIARVLITCDETNIGSRKIIEKNGGVLENRVENPETGIAKLRYWIDT